MTIAIDGRELQCPASGDRSYWTSFLGELFATAPEDAFVLAMLPDPVEVEYPGRGLPNVSEERLAIAPGILWTPVAWPRAMRRRRADLLHAQYLIPPLTRLPTVVTIHDVSFLPHPEWFPARQRRIMAALIPLSARRATRVVTGSEHAAGEIARWCRVPRAKIEVVPYAVDARFQPGDGRATAARYGLTGPYILVVGLSQPRKHICALIDAFAPLAAERPGLRLALAGGEGGQGEAITAAVDRHGLGGAVVRCGRVPDADLPDLYRAAVALAYPSLYEGFGLPALEAMACGTPVVADGGTSVPEVLGEAGLLVDTRSHSELAGALRRIVEDGALGARLSAAGLARAAGFRSDQLAAAHLAIYRRLLGGA